MTEEVKAVQGMKALKRLEGVCNSRNWLDQDKPSFLWAPLILSPPKRILYVIF